MSLRKLLLLPLAAVMGAAIAVSMASAAAPSEVKLEVNDACYFEKWPCWNVEGNPPGNVRQIQPITIAQGGTIAFRDPETKNPKTEAPTDVVWKGAAPSCTGVVESPPVKSGWSGTCTFSTAGEYQFESEELFNDGTFNYTKYKVIVEKPGGGGGGGTGTTPTGTTPTSKEQTPTGTTTSGGSGSQSQGGSSSGQGGSTSPLGSLFVGTASQAVKLASTQHGQSVHGSVDVSQVGSGGTLVVQLLASHASLASASHQSHVVVGRFVRSSVHAGTITFTVALNAKAKHALRRRGHLTLTVKIVLSATGATPQTITRSVTLRG